MTKSYRVMRVMLRGLGEFERHRKQLPLLQSWLAKGLERWSPGPHVQGSLQVI